MCTSCTSLGYINQKRDIFGTTLQTGTASGKECVCPANTIDLSTIQPAADGNVDWHLSMDFTQSRCETRLRSIDTAICGPSCAKDIFTLIKDMKSNDVEFTPGNANDCPARCPLPNTTAKDLQTQPGWYVIMLSIFNVYI
jgi:hypothetical protein